MKKIICCFTIITLLPGSMHAQDPITLVIKEAITKAIVALDLKVQRLQNKTIWLQNAQKAVENTMSKLQLQKIADWSEKQKQLYQNYFDELWKVKDAISSYHKVRDIVQAEQALLRRYQQVRKHISTEPHFTTAEKQGMLNVYAGMLEASVQNVSMLELVVRSFLTQMSDAKRTELIDAAWVSAQHTAAEFESFTQENRALAALRAQGQQESQTLQQLYRQH